MPNGFHAPNTHVKEFTLGSNYAKKVMCPIAIYSMPDETYDQCKTTTVVSPETTVGTYSGFRENWAPTVVFSYSGPLLPTVVFCRPQADTISSSSGLEARRRRKNRDFDL